MEIVISALTFALVVLAFLTWRTYMKMAWLSGALESHSQLMLHMKAMERGVKVVWWDPDLAKPPKTRAHGESVNLDTIYSDLPQHERSGWINATKWQRFRRWLNAEI
jgi:hypothetical protein